MVMTTTLAQVAHEVAWCDRPEPMPARGIISLGPEASRLIMPREAPKTRPVRRFTLSDVVLDCETQVLLKDGRPMRDTAHLVSEDELAALAVHESELAEVDGDAPVAIGRNRGSPVNWYHWLVQVVPSIHASLQANPDVRLGVGPHLPWHEQTLELLGYAGVPRVALPEAGQVRLRRTEYTEFLAGMLASDVSACALAAWHRMRQAVPQRDEPRARIYVARGDAGHRRVINDDAVIALLQARGFTVIEAGTMSVAEQVAAFRDARIVLGPHGAGMGNLVFCRPGAVAYELFASTYLNGCMAALALGSGMHYFADAFEAVKVVHVTHDVYDGIRVDLDRLSRRLDEIEMLVPDLPQPQVPRPEPSLRAEPAPETLLEPAAGSYPHPRFHAEPFAQLQAPPFSAAPPLVINRDLIPESALGRLEQCWNQSTFESRAVNVYRLHDVHYLYEGVVFDRDFRLFAPHTYPSTIQNIAEFRYWLREAREKGRVPSIRTPSVVGTRRHSANYGHYMADMFPRSFLGETVFREEKPFHLVNRVNGRMLDVVHDALGMIGIHLDRMLIMDDRPVHFEDLIVVENVWEHDTYMSPFAMDAIAALSAQVPPGPDRKLLVVRSEREDRPLVNQDRLIATLQMAGFRAIYPGELTLREQIAAFKGARVVVGVMGSGFGNIQFCEPGARAILLAPASHPDTYYFFLSALRGLEYVELRGAQVDPEDWNKGFGITDQDIEILASM